MNNSTEIYDSLIDSLINMLVIYIPDHLIDTKILDTLDNELKDQVLNKFVAISNNDVVEKSMIELHKFQSDKTSVLENNELNLLGYSNKLSHFEFHVLATKYIDYVEFLASVSKWLSDYLDNFTKREIDLDWNTLIINQTNQLNNHFQELYKIFSKKIDYKAKEYYTNKEFLEKYLPNFISRYTGFIDKYNLTDITDIKSQHDNYNEGSDASIKPIDNILTLTDNEIELYLLESVFNVNIVL